MLAWETSVTTAWAWAKLKRAPRDASLSRLGVIARPPYAPTASARSVSMVTKRMLRSGLGISVNDGPPRSVHAPRAIRPRPRRYADHEVCRVVRMTFVVFMVVILVAFVPPPWARLTFAA